MFQRKSEPMRRLASLSLALVGVLLLTSCSLLNNLLALGTDTTQLMRNEMAHIVEALNDHDAAALRARFTDYALTEYSTDIDEGVAHLLALFPDGDLIWRDNANLASETGSIGYGTILTDAGYVVTSGGNDYVLSFSLFTYNTNDPGNVGIYQLGAVPYTASEDSGLEQAFSAWPGPDVPDTRTGPPPGVFFGDSGALTRDRATQIIDALNAHDAAALTGMFTEYARAEHSKDIDRGLDYLFSLFPYGKIVMRAGSGGSGVYQRVDGEKRTVLLPTFYNVSSGGVDYRLFFADFTENTIDPDNVGIYAFGVAPAAECRRCVPEAGLNTFARSIDAEATGHPGIFIPPEFIADTRMEQIAVALDSHDAAALKSMFSTEVLAQSPEIDRGVDYLLSLFPNGGITWTRDPEKTDDNFPIDSYQHVESRKKQESVFANYKVSADGKDYWLHLTENAFSEIEDPGLVGLYKLGVTPWTDDRGSGAAEKFYDWVHVIVGDPNVDNQRLGIYVPR
jgi:hypothetical protein